MSGLKANLEKLITTLKDHGFEVKVRRTKLNDYHRGMPLLFKDKNDDKPVFGDHIFRREYKIEEHKQKGKARYARRANGFTVVHLTKNGKTFLGRSICSASDKFHGDIGALKAISHALRTNNIKILKKDNKNNGNN